MGIHSGLKILAGLQILSHLSNKVKFKRKVDEADSSESMANVPLRVACDAHYLACPAPFLIAHTEVGVLACLSV